MVRIEKERYVDGNYNAVMDLQVSTTAELPDMGDTIGLYTVAPGSIAQIIQADSPTFVTLDDDGTWYPEQSDSSASSLNASLSMSPTLGKAIADSKDDMIDLTEDDIDRISDELEKAEEPDVTDKIEKSILYPDEPELTEKEQPEMKKSEPTEGGEGE